jgi:hypothetical protein
MHAVHAVLMQCRGPDGEERLARGAPQAEVRRRESDGEKELQGKAARRRNEELLKHKMQAEKLLMHLFRNTTSQHLGLVPRAQLAAPSPLSPLREDFTASEEASGADRRGGETDSRMEAAIDVVRLGREEFRVLLFLVARARDTSVSEVVSDCSKTLELGSAREVALDALVSVQLSELVASLRPRRSMSCAATRDGEEERNSAAELERLLRMTLDERGDADFATALASIAQVDSDVLRGGLELDCDALDEDCDALCVQRDALGSEGDAGASGVEACATRCTNLPQQLALAAPQGEGKDAYAAQRDGYRDQGSGAGIEVAAGDRDGEEVAGEPGHEIAPQEHVSKGVGCESEGREGRPLHAAPGAEEGRLPAAPAAEFAAREGGERDNVFEMGFVEATDARRRAEREVRALSL